MFNRVSVPAILLVATLVSLSACGKKEENGTGNRGAATVGVMVVQSRSLNLTQELTGRTSAWLISEVRPQVSGIIKARQFTEGANVSAGVGAPLHAEGTPSWRSTAPCASLESNEKCSDGSASRGRS